MEVIVAHENSLPGAAYRAQVVLKGHLTSNKIDSVMKKLMNALQKTDVLLIHIHEVDMLDLPFLQMIYAFQRAAITEGKQVKINMDLPESMQKIVNLPGLCTKFNLTA